MTLREKAAAAAQSNGSGHLGKGERVILTAIAQHRSGVTREQLSVLTGYKKSSRDTYLQKLGAAGFTEISGAGTIVATNWGVVALGDFEPLPTGRDLLKHWLRELPEGEGRVLEFVASRYPNSVQRQAIDEATGYKKSSRDTYIQKLGARKLVTAKHGGLVRMSEELS